MSQLHILVCGAPGSGKSSWIKRVATGMFPSKLENSPFATGYNSADNIKVVLIDGEPNEAKGFDGVVIMGDASDHKSFENFTGWIETSRKMNKCPIILVANKSDLVKPGTQLGVKDSFRCGIDRIAAEEGLSYFYVSAKEGANYYAPMEYLINRSEPIYRHEPTQHPPSPALRAQEFNRKLNKGTAGCVSKMDLTDT